MSSSKSSSFDLSKIPIPFNKIIEYKFKVGEKIANGSYGIVTFGSNILNGEAVAIKWELMSDESDLKVEWDVYNQLQNVKGIPKMFWFGTYEHFNVLVMELLGPSLSDLLHDCKGKFSLKTTLLLGVQIINIIKTVHKKGFLHGDIKPENFVMGRGINKNTLHLVDFGLATPYRDAKGKHVARKRTNAWAGTLEFLSLNLHDGYNASRRDDLESIGYTLVYLLRGSLPWESNDSNGAELDWHDADVIGEIKRKIPIDILCLSLPSEVKFYFEYVSGLSFAAAPNYTLLKNKMQDLYRKLNYELDMGYDWTKI